MEPADAAAATEANRLYWETDLSVGEIAQRLDMSRRALYDAITPVAATGRCSRCGGELEFTNRSARAHGFASCRSCGLQTAGEAEPAPWTWSPPAAAAAAPPAELEPAQSVWWLGAAALAGALVAAAATLALLRED